MTICVTALSAYENERGSFMKKVLIDTYDTAFQNVSGGVRNRILSTVSVLKKKGFHVEYFEKYKTKIRDYDILHIFMLKIDSYSLIQYAKENGLKVVISSIVILTGEEKLRVYWKLRKLPIMTTYKILFHICSMADSIIAETTKEAKFLEKYYHVPMEKIAIIPNGATKMESKSQAVYERIGKKCEYALEVGRFDSNKNQLSVIKALKNTNLEMVFIGGESFGDPQYYKKCIELAKNSPNIHFLGWLDREDELLKSAFCNAKAIISSSYHETFGLTIIEGIMAGAIPVVSNTLPILDYDSLKNCIRFNPRDVADIREKINFVMKHPSSELEQNELIDNVSREFSWDKVAVEHIKLYGALE